MGVLLTCPFHAFSVLCSFHFCVRPFLNFKTFQRPFIYPIKAGFYRDGVVHFLSNEPNTKNSIDKAEETPSASEDPRAAPARQAQDFRRWTSFADELEGLAGCFARLGAGIVGPQSGGGGTGRVWCSALVMQRLAVTGLL